MKAVEPQAIEQLRDRRQSRSLRYRLFRMLSPPSPFVHNKAELTVDAPMGRWNLYIGGAGSSPDHFVNVDICPMDGVHVCANAEALPFADNTFQRVECDAVLEHVENPDTVVREIERLLAPGGFAHIVVPFCHPLHEYPKDFRRFTVDALKLLAGRLEVVAVGWRTGPTATILVFVLEYAKLFAPGRIARAVVHGFLGWLLFPLRYLDVILLKSPRAAKIGNHCYMWVRKPSK